MAEIAHVSFLYLLVLPTWLYSDTIRHEINGYREVVTKKQEEGPGECAHNLAQRSLTCYNSQKPLAVECSSSHAHVAPTSDTLREERVNQRAGCETLQKKSPNNLHTHTRTRTPALSPRAATLPHHKKGTQDKTGLAHACRDVALSRTSRRTERGETTITTAT